MENCVFCKIITGQAEASIIYQDELVTAFLDIRPINPGHVLVVPNWHAANLGALDESSGARVFQVGQRLAGALYQSGLRCEGVNFLLADGAAAGQEVFHIHLHIVPRYKKDGFGFKFNTAVNYHQPTSREALNQVAEKIRAVMGRGGSGEAS